MVSKNLANIVFKKKTLKSKKSGSSAPVKRRKGCLESCDGIRSKSETMGKATLLSPIVKPLKKSVTCIQNSAHTMCVQFLQN